MRAAFNLQQLLCTTYAGIGENTTVQSQEAGHACATSTRSLALRRASLSVSVRLVNAGGALSFALGTAQPSGQPVRPSRSCLRVMSGATPSSQPQLRAVFLLPSVLLGRAVHCFS